MRILLSFTPKIGNILIALSGLTQCLHNFSRNFLGENCVEQASVITENCLWAQFVAAREWVMFVPQFIADCGLDWLLTIVWHYGELFVGTICCSEYVACGRDWLPRPDDFHLSATVCAGARTRSR
jgi:hypothetical protein